jgi:hypothetical protein
VTTINTNFLPSSSGLSLGSPSQRWAGSFQNVTITGGFSAPGTGLSAVTYSATPTFDGSQGGTFEITLTGNVTSSSVANLNPGLRYIFIIHQDVIGNRTFVWPSGTSGAMVIDSTSQSTNVQEFVWNGTNLFAVSAGVSM